MAMTNSRQPLKDVLDRTVDDMNILLKEILAVMCLSRDTRPVSNQECGVAKLVEMFKMQAARLADGLKLG